MGDWKIVGSAGTVVAASIPDAPNVLDTGGTLTTVTVTYGLIGNASAFGFSWSISLPEGHADYAHLKKIHVVWVRAGHLVELATHYRPWSSSPLLGDSGVDPRFFQDASSHSDAVKFLCENDNGTITASPVSKTVTVAASAVSAVSGADASSLATNNPEYHARFKDRATALHTVVNGHVSMSGALYPQTATLWINKQDGNGPQWQGWWKISEGAQLVQIGLPDSNTAAYPPGGASDGSWLLIAAAGAIPKESSVPASAVTSSPFTVPTIPAPSSSWATAAWIDQINYGNNGQVNTWGWKNLFTTLPYDNPDFFFGRWTVQNGSLVDGVFTPGTAGNFAQHDGAEVAFSDDDNGGNGATVLRTPGTNIVTVTNPLMWTLPAYRLGDGSLNPNSCFRFRNYTGSRRDTDGSGGTIAKQNDWSAGVGVSTPGTADHLDVVLDLTNALIDGGLLVVDSVPASAISAVNASDIQGTIYASSIGSVNAATLNGTIYASSIGSVNASTLNGTIYASSIGSVSASTIAGTIYASSIGSVSAAILTGMIYASSIGSVSAATIAGIIYASSIASIAASQIAGTVYASSIGSVAASVINRALYASSIASVSATTINGLIVTSQIAAGIMDSLNKFAAGLSVVQRVAALPSTTGLPEGALALLTTPSPARLYQIVSAVWTLVTASTAITGQLQATDIANIQASQINGLILAGQISQINASQINGAIYASSIGSVSASVLAGSIYASSIATVNTGALVGTISAGTLGTVYATSIASVYATAISGTISAATLGMVYASSIATVNAGAIAGTISAATLGTVYASSIATVNATALAGKIYASSIGSVAASTISGTISAVNLGTIYASSIGSVAASSIGSVYASSITMGGTSSIDSVNVGSGGMFFTGTGGIVIAGSGGLSILVGAANANYFRAAATIFPDSGGFQIGTTVCIDATAKGNFSSLQVQGGTRIDSSANGYFANISRNGTEIGSVFAAKGTYNVMDGGNVIGTVTL